jgi:hypothetical protein
VQKYEVAPKTVEPTAIASKLKSSTVTEHHSEQVKSLYQCPSQAFSGGVGYAPARTTKRRQAMVRIKILVTLSDLMN